MPNGPSSPSAKIRFSDGASAPSAARRTRILPDLVSAMKTSPFGAVRRSRGPESPEAKSLTENPDGTERAAPAGLSTVEGPFPAEPVAKGAGKRSMRTECTVPGASLCQSPALFCPLAAATAKAAGSTAGSVARYEMRSFRSERSATTTTMAVPGTSAGGLERKRSRVPRSHVRRDAASAFVYPKNGMEAAGRPTTPARIGPCPALACFSSPAAWQSAQYCWKRTLPCEGSPSGSSARADAGARQASRARRRPVRRGAWGRGRWVMRVPVLDP